MSQIIENNVIYTKIENNWIVGTNSTISGNAILEGKKAPIHLIIPKRVKGHKIQEIGRYAFREHREIVSVRIFAAIKQINHHAFSRCSSIAFISIPSSVEYIFNTSLYFGVDNSVISNIVTTIFFEPESKLKFIDHTNFCNTKYVSIYFCGNTAPEYIPPLFREVTDVLIFTPNGMEIFGKQSKEDPNVCLNYPNLEYQINCLACKQRKYFTSFKEFLYILIINIC